jgi:UDP-N-acetylglucosamine--N-acetylmuramyl-(pentapeptide) pyrophosphoryl-undecaprenol N-acetylglucosamine transferase
MTRTVLLAAGGTGGHIFPGLATAEALRAAHPDLAVEFVGTADRMEATLVPQAGWTLHTVPAAALTARAAVTLPVVLGRSVAQVRRLIRERDVVAAVCFGGYTSVPLALAARLTGTPLVVHEQNAVPGKANQLSARSAAAVAISYPEAASAFGRARTVLTGNPVRPDLLAGMHLDGSSDTDPDAARTALRAEAVRAFGLDPNRRTLLVFGGSLGARRINEAVVGSVGRWEAPDDLQVLHAAGSRTFAETSRAWDTTPQTGLGVRCLEFIDRMDLAYAAADVVVCRAGASSIAELTALAIPSILVPYPHARADEQTANARSLAAAGGAVLVHDDDMGPDALVAAAQPLLVDPARHAAMSLGAADFGRPRAAADLAALVGEVSDLGIGS